MVVMSVQNVTAEEAKEILDRDSNVVYIDVRTENEFMSGHVPNAVNVPVVLPDPATRQMKPNPEFIRVVSAHFPKNKRIIKKQPQKLLTDLRILNMVLDHLDAKICRQIIKQNLFLFDYTDELPEVFKTTFSVLKYLCKGKFNQANAILEKCEKTTLAVAAAMPKAHAPVLVRNDDLIEFAGRI